MSLPHLIFRRSAGFASSDAQTQLDAYNTLFGLTPPGLYAGVFANLAAQGSPTATDAAWAFCISDPGQRPAEPTVDIYPDSAVGRSYVPIAAAVEIGDIYSDNAEWYVQVVGP